MSTTVVGGCPSATTDAASGWQEQALCAQTDAEAFFPDKGVPARAAKAVCGQCSVRAECLDAALQRDEMFGIWGGLSRAERAALKRRRASLGGAA